MARNTGLTETLEAFLTTHPNGWCMDILPEITGLTSPQILAILNKRPDLRALTGKTPTIKNRIAELVKLHPGRFTLHTACKALQCHPPKNWNHGLDVYLTTADNAPTGNTNRIESFIRKHPNCWTREAIAQILNIPHLAVGRVMNQRHDLRDLVPTPCTNDEIREAVITSSSKKRTRVELDSAVLGTIGGGDVGIPTVLEDRVPRADAYKESRGERQVKEFIQSLGVHTEKLDFTDGTKREIDIYLPDFKLGIEYNGLSTHSSLLRPNVYRDMHVKKVEYCRSKGIRLVFIREDHWQENPEIIKKYIRALVQKTEVKPLSANKCQCREVPAPEANMFLDQNHIQGGSTATFRLGLYRKGKLVALAAFTRNGFNYDLVRYASSRPIIAGLHRLTIRALRKVHPTSPEAVIHTLCDLSMFDGESYIKAGYVPSGKLAPDYIYVKSSIAYNKRKFRKAAIKKKHPEVYNSMLTEWEMMQAAKYGRYYDVGKRKYSFFMP